MDKTKSRFVLQTQQSQEPAFHGTVIKVIGVGGGGSNAVDHMTAESIDGVNFYVANTDVQALTRAQTPNKIQFGSRTTQGLGSGFDPQKGKAAAVEDKDKLMEALNDAELLFITAGMGGGTGTGAAPVIAQAVKEVNPNALVIAVVTTPFSFEGARRMEFAETGIEELRAHADSLISISNDKILTDNVPLNDAYSTANDVLLNAVRGIADVILNAGFINVDFADVQTVMSGSGTTMLGQGRATGDDRAKIAIESALNNPLLDDFNIADARGLLVNVTASSKISSSEFKEIGEVISKVASGATSITTGLLFDDQLGDEIRITIIASGLEVDSVKTNGHADVNERVQQNGHAEQHSEQQNSLDVTLAPTPPPEPGNGEVEHSQINGLKNGTSYANADTMAESGLYIDEFDDEDSVDEPETEYIPSILRKRSQLTADLHLPEPV